MIVQDVPEGGRSCVLSPCVRRVLGGLDRPTPGSGCRRRERSVPVLRTEPLGAGMTAPSRGPGREIAVIGFSCRVPGAADPTAFWKLLSDGVDAVTERPSRRFSVQGADDPDHAGPGAVGTRREGQLEAVEEFDAEFFGIPPRDAAAMDPQQRLMLELGWEALEHAGTVPRTLCGGQAGVFVGATAGDYALLTQRLGLEVIDRHTMPGLNRAIIANRIAHFLDLRGPSFTIDSGQSASLVAVHLACESLRSGACDLALAGGVQLNLVPESTISAARFGGLSPDGRCHTFDSRANGFVRGEGAGLVVLKPLAAALADGNTVYAVIHGSAVNTAGATEELTTPSAASQEEVLRRAYAAAGVDPREVAYVELHGTGTKVGDPIEAAALGAAFGRGSREAPLLVGSVKTNIGHLEGAAGIAGLLKVVLALGHGQLPPSLNYAEPNPDIPLDELGLRVVQDLMPCPEARPYMGVSSFGMGGTNCHVVLGSGPAAAPAPPGPAPREDAVLPWVVTGHSADALREQVARLRAVAESDVSHADLAWSLATCRTAFAHRAVITGRNRADRLAALDAVAAGAPAVGTTTGVARPGRVAFVFPGQGSQWLGMARELWASSEVFGDSMRRCEEALAPHVDWSLQEVLHGSDEWLDRVDVVQPALFAVMVSLSELWSSWGVRPDAVVGHSQGEIAAACVAGALSLEDAALVVARRSAALRNLPAGGAMWSVALAPDEVASRLSAHVASHAVSVAAVNGPRQVVLSGDAAALEGLGADWAAQGVRVRRIPVDYASHGAQVEAVREQLLAELSGISPRPARLPFHSTVDGKRISGESLDAEYWYRNLRSTVRFHGVCRDLLAEGFRLFVEPSPHPGLVAGLQETFAEEGAADAVVVGSLQRHDGGPARMTAAAAEAFTTGGPVDWRAVLTAVGCVGNRVELPTYAFQRRRHWLDGALAARQVGASTSLPRRAGAPGETRPAVPVSPRAGSVLDEIRVHTAIVLGHTEAAAVDPVRTFKDQGVGSVAAVELCRRLGTAMDLVLPPNMVFDHPTPELLARVITRPEPGEAERVARVERPVLPVGDPVVIVGMSCRYPGGVASPEDLWQLVSDGVDAIGTPPPERGWDRALRGGFLPDAAGFDAAFFDISPREALAMDPQQRLLLEVSWEALERARIAPQSLRGSPTAVFIGAMGGDYGPRLHEAEADVAGYRLTGAAGSVTSGRIAYLLGLEGPAITVDTACSSSLVALHLAVRGLRQGDCDLALAGGATVMSTPGMFQEFSRQGGLAPDGTCKAFSAAADGTTWSEGVAVVVLERLSDARRLGHPVLAVVRGSAVNQDGASNGLTAPKGSAQRRVITRALDDGRLSAADVDAVEAHGTGTPLGDPIEAQALLATYGRGRSHGRPLLLGSLKSNIGHTQAAAGLGGVIKMVMALRHGRLPRTLHVDRPTPHVDWTAGAVALLTETRDWPDTGRPRRAAVSSFGISGTNAHVVLEQASPAGQTTGLGGRELPVVPFVVSGRGPAGLRAQARRLLGYAEGQRGGIADTGFSLATTRSPCDHRAVVLASDRDELLSGLRDAAEGQVAPGVVEGSTAPVRRTAFVFPGQGGQWAGMAVELLDTLPVFADHLRACEEAFAAELDWSPIDVLRGVAGAPQLDRVDVVQPLLFAVMTGLAAVWRSVGVEPDAVVGHSQGEIAAAYVAGALSLADAARVVILRSRCLGRLAGTGGMVSVLSPADEVRARLAPWGGRLEIAAVNGPGSTVVSGDVAALDELLVQLQDVRARRIPVDYASHSAQVEALREELAEALVGITPRACDIAFYSTVTAERLDTAELDAGYWFRNLRETVRFEPVVRAMHRAGCDVFVEASPHPVLGMAVEETLAAPGGGPGGPVVVGSLRRGEGGLRRMLASLSEAYVCGVDVDWARIFEGTGAGQVDLPTYAFQHQRFWLEPGTSQAAGRDGADRAPDRRGTALDGSVDDTSESVVESDLARQLAAMSESDQRRAMLQLVRTHAAAVQGHFSPESVDAERGLREQGLTSVAAVDFRNRLSSASGLGLPITIAFDHPSPTELAEHLRTRLLAHDGAVDSSGLLAEIDKLASMMSTASASDRDRLLITARLEDLLAEWDPRSVGREASAIAGKLSAVSDQELIDYIGNELGIS
ncbi:acyltransferase domain-containing protein [Streptomyces sp. NPDC006476]|uniref:type I polyketide synthase n=1 Tax=Streptomyces sp. NPDC006476 TaxID=3157175 RepID=UPI0033AB641C